MAMEVKKKLCIHCKEEKMWIYFRRTRCSKDGFEGVCKDCQKARRKKSTLEMIREKQRDEGSLDTFRVRGISH